MNSSNCDSPEGFEEFLDDYLEDCKVSGKGATKLDRQLLAEASQWLGWCNDECLVLSSRLNVLRKQLEELGEKPRV